MVLTSFGLTTISHYRMTLAESYRYAHDHIRQQNQSAKRKIIATRRSEATTFVKSEWTFAVFQSFEKLRQKKLKIVLRFSVWFLKTFYFKGLPYWARSWACWMKCPQTWTVCSGRPYEHVHITRNEVRNLKPMAMISPWLHSSVKGRLMVCAYHRHGLKISNLPNHRSVVWACSYGLPEHTVQVWGHFIQ
jgi:hypothetical protein